MREWFISDKRFGCGANIWFAMGAMGTDAAIETADVASMDEDFHKIPTFVRLFQGSRSVLLQNNALALGIKAVFSALTLIGWDHVDGGGPPTWTPACW